MDRHPVATVFVAAPAIFILVSVMLAYWWFTIPVTVIVCAVLLNWAARRRAAFAARAEWDYRQEMVAAVRRLPATPRPLRADRPRNSRSSRHVMNHWPTTPMPTQPIRKAAR